MPSSSGICAYVYPLFFFFLVCLPHLILLSLANVVTVNRTKIERSHPLQKCLCRPLLKRESPVNDHQRTGASMNVTRFTSPPIYWKKKRRPFLNILFSSSSPRRTEAGRWWTDAKARPSSNRQFDVDLSDKESKKKARGVPAIRGGGGGGCGQHELKGSSSSDASTSDGHYHGNNTTVWRRRRFSIWYSSSFGPSGDLSLPARILTWLPISCQMLMYNFYRYLFIPGCPAVAPSCLLLRNTPSTYNKTQKNGMKEKEKKKSSPKSWSWCLGLTSIIRALSPFKNSDWSEILQEEQRVARCVSQ